MATQLPTHSIEFKKDGEGWHRQPAYGMTDLINIISAMQKDGYTNINLTVLKAYSKKK